MAKDRLGINAKHTQAYNAGVVIFNNSQAVNFKFFEKFYKLYMILAKTCPSLHLLEQICLAALASNMGNVKALPSEINYRVKTTKRNRPSFTTDIAILHFITAQKPWKPLSPEDLVSLTKARRPMLPFYRVVWLDYASRVEGFADFCDQRPYSAVEIMCMANTILLVEKKMLEQLSRP